MAEQNNNTVKEFCTKCKAMFDKFLNMMPEYLRTRFISAVVLIPIAIIIIYSTQLIFTFFAVAMAILMAFEWNTITRADADVNKWSLMGLVYIIVPVVSLIYIRSTPRGSDIILWLFLVVWATDIGGLLVGRTLGGPKLAPVISPNKTWSGLLGGMLASMFVGLITSVIFKESATFFIFFSGALAVLEQMGDLIESKFKRNFSVKDSGNIIPGHGGIMDRLDGFTIVAPVVALIVMFSKTIF